MCMITIQDVSLFYKHNKSILENINLKILPGRIYGLLGKNGEGKTTLLNILSGQLFPDKGICNVSGEVPSCRNISFLTKVIFNAGRAKDAGDKDKRIYPDVCSLLSRLQQRDLDDLLRIIRNRPLRPVGPDISGGKKESDHLTGLFNPYSVTFDGRTDQRAGHSLKGNLPEVVGFFCRRGTDSHYLHPPNP